MKRLGPLDAEDLMGIFVRCNEAASPPQHGDHPNMEPLHEALI